MAEAGLPRFILRVKDLFLPKILPSHVISTEPEPNEADLMSIEYSARIDARYSLIMKRSNTRRAELAMMAR